MRDNTTAAVRLRSLPPKGRQTLRARLGALLPLLLLSAGLSLWLAAIINPAGRE